MTNAKSSTKEQSTATGKATAQPKAAEKQPGPPAEITASASQPDSQQGDVVASVNVGTIGEVDASLHPAAYLSVIEVKAKPKQGFWRAGRFWPSEPVNAFVVADVEAARVENGGMDCFITPQEYARLKAEPMLDVTELEVVVDGED